MAAPAPLRPDKAMKYLFASSVSRIDLIIWLLVILFFCGSSLIFAGDLWLSVIGAAGIIIEMLIIGICIEIIIEALKRRKGIGTITGFITNGPEALCLIVGLAVDDILFAASTPLGSNFMNPLLLFIAALLSGAFVVVLRCRPAYTVTTVMITMTLAVSFFLFDIRWYPWWAAGAVCISLALFLMRPHEVAAEHHEVSLFPAGRMLLPAIVTLIAAGYLLDPIVDFAANHSKTPKGVIGFFVLATLTSWPEFKSCMSLLAKKKVLASILNITVSNITNLWLAAIGVITYLLLN